MGHHRAVEYEKREMILHVIKSLVGLPSLHTLGFVGVIVGCSGSDVRLVGSVVGHPVVPEEYQKIVLNKRQKNIKKHLV